MRQNHDLETKLCKESYLLLLFIVPCRSLSIFLTLASNFLLVCVLKMNRRRNTGRGVGNQASPQAPASGVIVHVNPAALSDGEVRALLVQISQAITAHA